MNKELLNKILPYCGYGLKVLENQCVRNVVGIYYDKFDYEQGYSSRENGDIGLAKPILFPADCLTQEIETEYGKETPLIELATIEAKRKAETNSSEISGILAERYHEQWEIFQYLYSRHIAFNLDPDDYVSVESLEKNPYAVTKLIS